MEKFTVLKAVVAPLDRANVDTDAIIPKQFLKAIGRTGFGVNLFDEWRYLDHGEPGMDNSKRPINTEFVLNQPRYQGAKVLLARENFGCGSSREHAPWALQDYGFRAILAPSFADIFFSNCFKNGLVPITLSAEIIDDLFNAVQAEEGYELTVDLEQQKIIKPSGETIDFSIDPFKRHCLINGLDEIGLTLIHSDTIKAYEEKRKALEPWIFA